MQDYRKLDVWQKAHKFALETYAVSAHLKHRRPGRSRSDVPSGHFHAVEHR